MSGTAFVYRVVLGYLLGLDSVDIVSIYYKGEGEFLGKNIYREENRKKGVTVYRVYKQKIPFMKHSISPYAIPGMKRAEPLKGDTSFTIDFVKEACCDYFNVKLKELVGKKRIRRFVIARHVAMYLLCRYTRSTLKEIGDAFGGRDHTTVINARRMIQNQLDVDETMCCEVRQLEMKYFTGRTINRAGLVNKMERIL